MKAFAGRAYSLLLFPGRRQALGPRQNKLLGCGRVGGRARGTDPGAILLNRPSVLGKILEIALLFLRFFLRARSLRASPTHPVSINLFYCGSFEGFSRRKPITYISK
jgi:hypothetical protein